MEPKRNLKKTLTQIATILLVAFALKYHYSIATVNDLRWILDPTRFLVELFTSHSFRFESYAGYLSDDRTFLIAASCAGVNFLIIAFLMLNAQQLFRERKLTWTYISGSMAVAYFATLIANTVRIAVALQMLKYDLRIGEFTDEDIHRLEGIVVYFGFLLALFFVTERILTRAKPHPSTLLRRSLIPLAIYYAATLGVPLARGAYHDAEFWQHALFVFLIPLVVIIPYVVFAVLRSGRSQTVS